MNYKIIHLLFFNPNHQNFYKDIIHVLMKVRQVHLHTCVDVGLEFSSINCITTLYKRLDHAVLINKVLKNFTGQELLIDEIFGLWLRINMVYLLRNKFSIIIHNVVKMSSLNYSNPLFFFDSIFRRIYYMKTRAVIAISPITFECLKSIKLRKNEVFLFPFSSRNSYENSPLTSEVVIGIVGGLNTRKNVLLLFKLLDQLRDYSGDKRFKFRILGDGQGYREVLNHYGVSYFESYLSEKDLNLEIKKCDVLLSLTHRETSKHGQIEYYGSTKDSGTFFDAYRNSKLVIAPDFYSNTWVRDFSFFYKNEDDIFEFLTNEKLPIYLSKMNFKEIDLFFQKRIDHFANFFK